MPETHFDAWIAQRYDTLWPELLDPSLLDSAVDVLAEFAGGGAALEFGIGTGRLALPLSRRATQVHGIELSPEMVAVLRAKSGAEAIAVTIGDFATTEVKETFELVYLARNTITNLTTQDEQVACFRNAAAHLKPDGHFVVENYIPALQRIPPGETNVVFASTSSHLGFEEYDIAAQVAISRHYWVIDGELRTLSSPHRYLWPSELDLMARLAGMTLRHRWDGWNRMPFTSASRSHVSVWQIDRVR